MQCVNVKVIFKKRQFQRILVLRSYFLSSKPNVSLKRLKKNFTKKNLETTLIKNVSGYQITINLLTLLKRTQEQLQYTSKRSENEKVGVVIEHLKC